MPRANAGGCERGLAREPPSSFGGLVKERSGMAEDPIRSEHEGAIATITLSRPDKLNAMTVAMTQAILAALDRAEADDSVRAVIVTGSGRAFCAGTDLSNGFDL